jgi:hypothetical protein
MAKTTKGLMIAAAGVATAMCFGVPESQAGTYGNAPWCAMPNTGTGEGVLYCYYRTVEECVPHVLAGNRGTCGQNPYLRGPFPPSYSRQ